MKKGFSLVVLSLLAVSANAGEVLKLKAGQVNLDSKNSRNRQVVVSEYVGVNEYVVQFNGPITAADRAMLERNNLKVLSYLPDDAYVVLGEGSKVLALEKTESVRVSAKFVADWKISQQFSKESVFSRNQRVRVHIRTAQAQFTAPVRMKLVDMKNVTVRFEGTKVIVADVPRNEVSQIAQLHGVEWIEPLAQVSTLDFDPGVDAQRDNSRGSTTGYESGTKVMNMDAAWARGFTGSGQTAAMADTGLDSGDMASLHKDLSNTKSATNVTFLPFTWADTNGHGTHVAGSILGNGAMSNGLIRGGAYQASFIAQAVMVPFLGILDPNALQDPTKTVGVAFNEGARIHSNSWGADSKGAYDAMAAAYDDYTWNNPDVLVVFANGNSGEDKNADGRIDEGSVGSPATAKNVMSVGASENYLLTGGIQAEANKLKGGKGGESWPVEPLYSDRLSDNANGMALFSSRGPTQDGRIKPDIVAPGTNIVSTRSSKIEPDKNDPNRPPLWGEYDANYLYCGGTSMATPLASGAATVARQFLVNTFGIQTPSAALIKASLMHTAFDMYPGQYGAGPKQELPTVRPNPHEGYGRIDMDKLTGMGKGTLIADERTGIALGEAREFTAQSEGSLIATLVYTDAPGAANASKALVNDIDLVVQTPDGQTLSKNDHTNNAEMIEIKGGQPGLYKIIVKGVNIPQGKNGKQPFALVVSPK